MFVHVGVILIGGNHYNCGRLHFFHNSGRLGLDSFLGLGLIKRETSSIMQHIRKKTSESNMAITVWVHQ